MSRSTDRILDVIDAGLQSSYEAGYGTDAHPHRCVRCQSSEPANDGDLCGECRAFLLGDSDTDPREGDTGLRSVIVTLGLSAEDAATAFRHVGEHLAASVTPALVQVNGEEWPAVSVEPREDADAFDTFHLSTWVECLNPACPASVLSEDETPSV